MDSFPLGDILEVTYLLHEDSVNEGLLDFVVAHGDHIKLYRDYNRINVYNVYSGSKCQIVGKIEQHVTINNREVMTLFQLKFSSATMISCSYNIENEQRS